jgi:hypothetical protein
MARPWLANGVLALALVLAGCASKEREWQSFGPEGTEHSLLIVFRRDTPPQEVLRVLTEALAIPHSSGSGHTLFPGVRASFKVEVPNHDAHLFTFSENSTPQQRLALLQAAQRESAVLLAVEDTLPAELDPAQLHCDPCEQSVISRLTPRCSGQHRGIRPCVAAELIRR